MHRRNPQSRNGRRAALSLGLPRHDLAACRRMLVKRCGGSPDLPSDEVARLRAEGAWFLGVDMRRAPDAEVARRVLAWCEETDWVEA